MLASLLINISIHAPARGATRRAAAAWDGVAISIHAPARGATRCKRGRPWRIYHFNPRSREGSDESVMIDGSMTSKFQSTLPRGERRYRNADLPKSLYFNPRSREGSDRFRAERRKLFLLFQSTLPRGERPCLMPAMSSRLISIHAPARGATSR